ncbi:complement C1q tumor necrosis factor-related protein 3-like isoform X2 [Crassostrea angulata]|uniref:complement C1q tumor necrosis factor-related protein 3-like isoform X2 n=1 Tax=Magallana angulata TaxID=2784310 RepID=UPI0022B0848A|nr:complement C1q tumor necrosis factor-related protein 3-like isoform X2 [Crassostrea angulata]
MSVYNNDMLSISLISLCLTLCLVLDTTCLLDLNSQQSPTTQSTSFLNQLLLQEQQLRIELQKQITGIQSQIQANNVVQVAFFVRLRDKITNHHMSTIMVFDDVQLNTGNAYDPHVGTFTAPVEGVYKFDLVLSSNVENGHGEMMHNGVKILDVYADKVNQSFYGRGSGSIIVRMAKGDKVWIQHIDVGNTVINGGIETAFSGHLLFAA